MPGRWHKSSPTKLGLSSITLTQMPMILSRVIWSITSMRVSIRDLKFNSKTNLIKHTWCAQPTPFLQFSANGRTWSAVWTTSTSKLAELVSLTERKETTGNWNPARAIHDPTGGALNILLSILQYCGIEQRIQTIEIFDLDKRINKSLRLQLLSITSLNELLI